MTEEGRIVNWGQIIAGIDADNILSALALLVSVVVGFVAYFQTHNANEAAKDANNDSAITRNNGTCETIRTSSCDPRA